MRSSTASAEMTRQVEISTLSAHQMAHGGVVAHTSSWTPAAYELEESSPPLDSHTPAAYELEESSPPLDSHIGGLPEPPDGRREQGDKDECVLMGLTAGNAAGRCNKYWNRGHPRVASGPCCPPSPWSCAS